jgi:hypothetical protein
MGLDMNMYAVEREITDLEELWEDYQDYSRTSWYWRKANQIHNWMVQNVQKGKDDCGLYEVSIKKILELHKEVTFALATKDTSKLPPTAGFFFGSTEVDEWYWEDLRDTKNYLEEMQEVYETDPATKFYYYASW